MTDRAAFVLFSCLFIVSSLAAQPTPQGIEFQVNGFDQGYQSSPNVAIDSAGRFVVVWRSSSDGGSGADDSGSSIWAQRYNPDGTPRGVSFPVNTFTTGNQVEPDVAVADDGSFVVVWASGDVVSPGPDGASSSIQGQRYTVEGTPLGQEFQVNALSAGGQTSPAISMAPDGRFVVVWEASGFPTSGVTGRSFGADAVPVTGEFGGFFGASPDVAVSNGQFVMAWVDDFADPDVTRARIFDFSGNALGDAVQVNTAATGGLPAVSSRADGAFTVVWESREAASLGVWGRRLDADGDLLGAELDLDGVGAGSEPAVASDADGNFTTVWQETADGSGFGIRGRSAGSGGTLTSEPFAVNTYTTNQQWFAAVASQPDGHLVVVWTGVDKDSLGIKGQRFLPDPALGPEIFSDGFESGDVSLWSSFAP